MFGSQLINILWKEENNHASLLSSALKKNKQSAKHFKRTVACAIVYIKILCIHSLYTWTNIYMSRVHTTQYTNYANYTVPRKLMTCTASLLKDYRPIIALDQPRKLGATMQRTLHQISERGFSRTVPFVNGSLHVLWRAEEAEDKLFTLVRNSPVWVCWVGSEHPF